MNFTQEEINYLIELVSYDVLDGLEAFDQLPKVIYEAEGIPKQTAKDVRVFLEIMSVSSSLLEKLYPQTKDRVLKGAAKYYIEKIEATSLSINSLMQKVPLIPDETTANNN